VAIARRATTKVPPRNGVRHCLLVVEDDPDLSNLLAEIFSVAGFEVRRAANRAQINAEVNKPILPDLILLDIVLPDADGMQILARLRAHPKFARMPVVMMTGRAEAVPMAHGGRNRKKAVVIISDGNDTSSRLNRSSGRHRNHRNLQRTVGSCDHNLRQRYSHEASQDQSHSRRLQLHTGPQGKWHGYRLGL